MERLRKIDHPEGKRQNYISNNAVAKYRMQLRPSLFMIMKHKQMCSKSKSENAPYTSKTLIFAISFWSNTGENK